MILICLRMKLRFLLILYPSRTLIELPYSNPMNVCGKNPTAFQGARKREQRIGKSFKSFIYFLIGRNRFRTAIYILVNIDFNIPNTKVTVLTNTDVYAQKSKV